MRRNLSREPGFVYGIDVPRFRDSDGDGVGDLEGVRRNLPYVASLGATWIWLLPFYESPWHDNGYDVVDHRAVHPRLGNHDAVRRLIEEAHSLGLRVMADLVVHHTSDRHPWFLAGREGRHPHRDFYVWRAEPLPPELDPPMFPGEQASAWTFDPLAGLWYRHEFYDFEPNLNVHNEAVMEELFRIAEFWVDEGVDGFRVDAASHLVDEEADLADTSLDFFDTLRSRLEARNPDIVLVGEADLPPLETAPFFTPGRFDGLLAFTLSNRLMLALARSDARMIDDTLAQLEAAAPGAGWVTFLRNQDELDLEQLDDEEREVVMRRFAPEPRHRLYGRGIRRGLAPMLGDPRLVEATMSLLFSLPGLPLLMAGQELPQGDDLSAPGRGPVRLAMQWDDGPAAGFTSADTSPYLRAAQFEGEYSVQRRNVADAERDPASLLHLVRALASRPRPHDITITPQPGSATVAPVLVSTSATGVTVHNLAAERVPLDGAVHGTHRLGPYRGGTIGPYEFGWFDRR